MAATIPRHDGALDAAATRRGYTTAAVTVLGLVVAMAAAEHGVGEVVQRPSLGDGPLITSWPDTPVFEQLNGEPAMTLLPDPVLAGAVTIVLAVLFAWVAVRNGELRHAGATLLSLAVALLLAGGGLAPPFIGVLLTVAWYAARRTSARDPGRVDRRLAASWLPALLVATASFLGLFPGTVLLHWWFSVASSALVTVLGVGAFGGLAVALTGAVAADRHPAHSPDVTSTGHASTSR